MNHNRKKWMNGFCEFLANDFSNKNITALLQIAEEEGVPCYFDNYEDAFDGLLLYDNVDFNIHINLDLGNTESTKRGRFTLAHELGHYFIDEHRLGLKYNLLDPHASFHNLDQQSLMETEADYFASCLLMPYAKFKKAAGGRGFSMQKIIDLSNTFRVSLPSTVLRFADIGTHEIFAVASKDGIVQWFTASEDFPKWKHNFQRKGQVPNRTVVGEFITLPDRKYTTIEPVDVDSWFKPSKDDNRAGRQMYEQCYYSDSYGYIISLLWFD